MTDFGQRDHRGVVLGPDAPAPAACGRGRQFTLLQMMKAVAIVGVALPIVGTAVAVMVGRPELIAFPDYYVILLIVAAGLYGLSWFPLRVRLAVELATACTLLILAAWEWRPPFYVEQAERSEELAGLCSRLADRVGDVRMRDQFRREADKYSRRAFVLRVQSMWYGLIRSATKTESPMPLTERDLILDLGLGESRDQYRRIAEEMGIPGVRFRP